jgi:hypothetical protein
MCAAFCKGVDAHGFLGVGHILMGRRLSRGRRLLLQLTEMKPEKRDRPRQQEEQAANADDVCSHGHGHDQEGNADSYYCANVVTGKVAREAFGRDSGVISAFGAKLLFGVFLHQEFL